MNIHSNEPTFSPNERVDLSVKQAASIPSLKSESVLQLSLLYSLPNEWICRRVLGVI